MFVNLIKIISSLPILTKISTILINQGSGGIDYLLDLLDEYSGKDKNKLILACLYHPVVLKNVLTPIFLDNLASKKLPSSKRNQAAAALSRFGMLLEDDVNTDTLSSLIAERNGPDQLLLTSCLVNSGVKGKKTLLSLMKKDITPELRSIICMYMREFASKTSIFCLEIRLDDNLPDSDQHNNYSHSWNY
jgi:hypothetical protein